MPGLPRRCVRLRLPVGCRPELHPGAREIAVQPRSILDFLLPFTEWLQVVRQSTTQLYPVFCRMLRVVAQAGCALVRKVERLLAQLLVLEVLGKEGKNLGFEASRDLIVVPAGEGFEGMRDTCLS